MSDGIRGPVLLLAAVVSLAAAFGCDRGGEAERRPEPLASFARPADIGAEARNGGPFPRSRGHVGVVVRERRVVVPAPFDARMLERFVQPGDEVRAGEPLARFDSESVDRAALVALAGVTEAEAALKVARVEAEQASGRYERRQGRPELFAEEQLQEVLAEVEVSRARLESAQAQLEAARAAAAEARAAAEKAVLRAPMEGVVGEVYGSPGMYDTRGASVVAIEAGEWHVRFAAPPEASVGFFQGSAIAVTSQDHEAVRGFVIYASPDLDSRTLLLTFEALLCSGDLLAGTPVRVLPVPRPAEGEPPLGCPASIEN